MKVTDGAIDLTIDIVATRLAEIISEKENIEHNEAVKKLMSTKTYKLLLNRETKLYLESVEHILDIIDAEEKNDIKRLLEV